MNKRTRKMILALMLVLALQACSKAVSEKHSAESHGHETSKHQHEGSGHSHAGATTMAHKLEDRGFIKLKGMYFKLAPDIEAGEDTHLDFYFRDAEGKHVTGAKISLILIDPKHESQDFKLTEDVTGEHYHTKTKLKDSGEYKSVVQVSKNDVSYNPRFVFENNTN